MFNTKNKQKHSQSSQRYFTLGTKSKPIFQIRISHKITTFWNLVGLPELGDSSDKTPPTQPNLILNWPSQHFSLILIVHIWKNKIKQKKKQKKDNNNKKCDSFILINRVK